MYKGKKTDLFHWHIDNSTAYKDFRHKHACNITEEYPESQNIAAK